MILDWRRRTVFHSVQRVLERDAEPSSADAMWISLAKIGTLGAGQFLFLLLSSRERSERLKCVLSQLFQASSGS